MGIAIRVDSQAERPRVRVAGMVQVIRHDRIGGMPALEAELHEGPGRVDLIWLGRASIPGIEPGSTVVAEGRLGVRRGRATMFNPRYELRFAAPEGPGVPRESELREASRACVPRPAPEHAFHGPRRSMRSTARRRILAAGLPVTGWTAARRADLPRPGS